ACRPRSDSHRSIVKSLPGEPGKDDDCNDTELGGRDTGAPTSSFNVVSGGPSLSGAGGLVLRPPLGTFAFSSAIGARRPRSTSFRESGGGIVCLVRVRRSRRTERLNTARFCRA